VCRFIPYNEREILIVAVDHLVQAVAHSAVSFFKNGGF
jgi:hypothetical protein